VFGWDFTAIEGSGTSIDAVDFCPSQPDERALLEDIQAVVLMYSDRVLEIQPLKLGGSFNRYWDYNLQSLQVLKVGFPEDSYSLSDLAALLRHCPSLLEIGIAFPVSQMESVDRAWTLIMDMVGRASLVGLQTLRLGFAPVSVEADITHAYRGDEEQRRCNRPADCDWMIHANSMKELTLTYPALCAAYGNVCQSVDAQGVVRKFTVPLEYLLPLCVKRFTLVCREVDLQRIAAEMTTDPYVAALEEMTFINFQKDHWISSRTGEGRKMR